MRLNEDITSIKGIGEKTAVHFRRAGIETVGDLLSYYPRGYEECQAPESIASLESAGTVVISGTLVQDARVRFAGQYKIVDAVVRDETGSMKVTWFNMPYLKNALQAGKRYILRGKLTVGRFGKVLEQPVIYAPENYAAMIGHLKPIYSLTAGLKANMISKAIRGALEALPELREYLPPEIRKKWKLAEYNYAIRTIHFPKDKTELMFARHRLVFDEFFFFILAVRYLKDHNEKAPNGCRIIPAPEAETFMRSLPYALTGAQRRCYEEIVTDLSGPKLMNRLVQGDVGSGKTVVALLALLQMVYAGYQGVLMAPTEVLARQHQETIGRYLNRAGLSFRVELLTGSMTAKEKRLAYERIEAGEADIIIGTHAVIQDKVHFCRLGLVITDEQHRFGVRQRETLIAKGEESAAVPPHVLVMSATPIPRTLAIILYGDLDISVIDEKPANRLPVKNCVIGVNRRKKAYEFITNQVKEGHQAYVICPLVEESEQMDGENVKDYADKLRTELPPAIIIGILHGRMKPTEKNQVMEEFAAGRIQVLVSTTVVEVGVDVPNATVMVIENAERFGLAQLHQLRGRIGRGDAQSYCIFINGSGADKVKRLEILNRSNDGFEIASEDLKLRGPGDIFGIRQSGILEFALGDIYTDANILQEASQAVNDILEEDYLLEQDSHRILRDKLELYMNAHMEKISL